MRETYINKYKVVHKGKIVDARDEICKQCGCLVSRKIDNDKELGKMG